MPDAYTKTGGRAQRQAETPPRPIGMIGHIDSRKTTLSAAIAFILKAHEAAEADRRNPGNLQRKDNPHGC